MIKSILLTTAIFPPDIGGPASYIPLLAYKLTEIGVDVKIITLADEVNVVNQYPFEVIRISRRTRKPFRDFIVIKKIVQQAKDVDLIFSNTLAFESAIAAKLSGKKIIQKIVGDLAWERASVAGRYLKDIDQYQNDSQLCLKSKLTNLYRNIGVKLSDQIIVPSEYLKGIVSNWGHENVSVVYNAVDLNPMKDLKDESQKKRNSRFRIVTVCRMVPWKGIEKILYAVKEISDVEIVLAGDGEYIDEYIALSKQLGISDRCFFKGRLSRNAVIKELFLADLFILNSSYEGLPHVVIEAFACNLPVIASRVGGTPEIVQDNTTGYLFEYNNLNQIVESIGEIRENKIKTKDMIYNSKELLSNFMLEKMVKETLDNMNKLVELNNGLGG